MSNFGNGKYLAADICYTGFEVVQYFPNGRNFYGSTSEVELKH